MNKLFELVLPAIILLLCVYGFLCELLPVRLRRCGAEAKAVVRSVDRTVAFGLRHFLATLSHDPKRERQFGCDYILSLQFLTPDGTEHTVQTTVPARMRMLAGERLPYFMAGDTVPIRYAPHDPKRLVVTLDEVARRQGALWRLIVWGFCTVLMLAVLVAVAVM